MTTDRVRRSRWDWKSISGRAVRDDAWRAWLRAVALLSRVFGNTVNFVPLQAQTFRRRPRWLARTADRTQPEARRDRLAMPSAAKRGTNTSSLRRLRSRDMK